MTSIVPVVLSGGSGTRLWPLSREKYPKQLLPLTADKLVDEKQHGWDYLYEPDAQVVIDVPEIWRVSMHFSSFSEATASLQSDKITFESLESQPGGQILLRTSSSKQKVSRRAF